MIRLVAPLVSVLLLLHFADAADLFSGPTRAVVAGILSTTGQPVSLSADFVRVGHLVIPWTRDCTGLNMLALLWAVTLWSNRMEALSRRWWCRMALAVPISFLANVARILTLVAYRWIVTPAVESPPLHYLIGFLWLVPFVGLVVPRRGKPLGWFLAESVHMVVVLALAAPMVSSPGGSLLITSVLLCLAHDGLQPMGKANRPWMAAWAAAGLLILMLRVESLWIPWLLACPLHAGWRAGRWNWPWWLLPATLPVVAIQPWAQVAFWILIGVTVWRLLPIPSHDSPGPGLAPPPLSRSNMIPVTVTLLFLVPFAVSLRPSPATDHTVLPRGVMKRSVGMNGYEIRLLGQSPDVRLIWYGPQGDGRHHTLPVCMRFRGVNLNAVTETPKVMTDGHQWLSEFFLLPRKPALDYPEYVWHTFRPLSSPGSHVIVSAPVHAMSASYFERTARTLVERLRRETLGRENNS